MKWSEQLKLYLDPITLILKFIFKNKNLPYSKATFKSYINFSFIYYENLHYTSTFLYVDIIALKRNGDVLMFGWDRCYWLPVMRVINEKFPLFV